MRKNPEDIYERISNNIPYHHNLKLYTKRDIEKCIEHFLEDEEYEKCQFLSNWIKTRFNHEFNWKEIKKSLEFQL